MKKIFLYAYDHINLGDDLFIETITDRYKDIEFYFWTNEKNKKVFQEQQNLKIIDENSTKTKLLKKIRPSLEARYKAGIQKNVMHRYISEDLSSWNIQHGKISYHGGTTKAISIRFLC